MTLNITFKVVSIWKVLKNYQPQIPKKLKDQVHHWDNKTLKVQILLTREEALKLNLIALLRKV